MMKLTSCSLQRAYCLVHSVNRSLLHHHMQYRSFITFNADNADDKKSESGNEEKSETSRTPKPLEKNFVFRVFQELGQKSQDRQQREALKHDPNETVFNESNDYFRSHDRPAHRLFGIYYKMAHSEIAAFHSRGFGSINHLLHPRIDEELPLFYEIVDGIFTRQIEFDHQKFMEHSTVTLNLDIGGLRDEMSGGRETKIDERVSLVFPPIYQPKTYDQQYSIIHDARDCIEKLKGNYFEYRGLSICKQLFVEMYRNRSIKNDLSLLSNDILIIDAHVYVESLEIETIKFPGPQLVSICDMDEQELQNKKQRQYLFCVLAVQNSIVTLKKREFDESNLPPNIPLAAGSVLLVDPQKYSSVLYWRRNNEPATFFINSYGEKFAS
mmetsp:Transcript_44114/g.70711  ORF Transcript_44114/g.70711 Transcript_44114/m.70711 type:complete len:382 (-) Transcript_44114:82-1227(-)